MIDRIEEVQCMIAAIQHCHDRSADHSSRIVKNLSWFEYVAQNAESMVSEWTVAKALGYDYTPGITWDKSKADVGDHIEVKWSANPHSNLWIQESDRHDRDIAVLVTGKLTQNAHCWLDAGSCGQKTTLSQCITKQLECASNQPTTY
jgi:hypothetical protein